MNGGGQMKPTVPTLSAPETMEVDEEGYQRPLPDDGVAVAVNRTSNDVGTGTVAGMEEGMRWSTKEWVAKVEDIYWTGLPTPPPSPPLTASNVDGFAPQVKINGTTNGHVNNGINRNLQSDQLAEEIVHEMCGDDASKRWEFMRTRFRKVESDVLSSGGVTHEAVVW